MKKQGILKIFAGMMLIATTTACGSSSAGVKNVDLKDPDGDYHVQVDFKTNEVKASQVQERIKETSRDIKKTSEVYANAVKRVQAAEEKVKEIAKGRS